MKTRYNALHSVAMMLGLLLVGGVTGAWANLKTSQSSNSYCSPKIHFKFPSGWTSAYLMIAGQGIPFPNARLGGDGWVELDLGVTKTNDSDVFYINGDNKNDCNDGHCVTKNGVNLNATGVGNNAQNQGWKCSDMSADSSIWIQEHPDPKKEGQVYYTKTKPDVKDFYVFLPDNQTWKSSTPKVLENGKDEVEMYVDNDHCGWYFRRYILDGKIDKELPTSVIIFRDDDVDKKAAIGNGGEKALNEGTPAEPIDLKQMFELFEQDPSYQGGVYLLADEKQADALGNDAAYGWSASRPVAAVGNCSYNLAAVIYDTDADLHPLFSCYKEGNGFQEGCQTDTKALPAIEKCIGVRQGLVESTLTIEKGKKKMKLTRAGQECFLDQATFDKMFNYTKGVNEMSCYDMKFERSPDGKWEFDSDYALYEKLKIPVQGGFYPVEDTDDAKIIATILPDGTVQTPAPKARTKRWAQGPVFYGPLLRANDPTEQIPKIDIFCNGPGWDKGHDCEGLFADGDGTTSAINSGLKLGTANQEACVFGWSCPNEAPADWPFYANGSETKGTESGRWDSPEGSKGNGGRNQHFCFESHANFRYKPGLKFNFRGDDDIWVFINNKLAVDLGGTHLAAPGYVDVDKFLFNGNKISIDSSRGKSFDIDIYFCDRRTTMSNVRIKTNMFIEQTTGITYEGKQDIVRYMDNGDNVYRLCYKKSGNGSCSAALGGAGGDSEDCGKDIKEKVTFVLTRDKTLQDPTKVVPGADAADFDANPIFKADSAINVTVPGEPIVNEEKLGNYLEPGKYFLVIKIGTDTKYIELNIKGSVSIADRDAVATYADGIKSGLLEHKTQAMASIPDSLGNPDPSQMLPLYLGTILDPCSQPSCTDPLNMIASANTPYTLQVKNDNKNVQFYKMKNGKLGSLNPAEGSIIGENGIDTIYVTIPFNDMTTAVDSVVVNVAGDARKATLKFFVPRLRFVDTDSTFNIVTQDPDKPKDKDIRLRGSAYDFYLVALDANGAPCGKLCDNFSLTKGSETSPGVNIIEGGKFVNGRTTITIQSQKVYEKCDNPDRSKCGKDTTATLHVVGPNASLTSAKYTNLQFQEPPVPTPLFADIFDVKGTTMPGLNIDNLDIYNPQQEYLDGIADSLVVYYGKPFKNHKDSLPDSILVTWLSDEKDSVRKFEADAIRKGAVCGADSGFGAKIDANLVDAEHCLGRITLGGKNLSNDVKTWGTGKVVSWASFTARGVPAIKDYSTVIYDRIAPVIISATAKTDTTGGKPVQLVLKFSENVYKTDMGAQEGDKNVFSYYTNAGKEHVFEDHLSTIAGTSNSRRLDSTSAILMFNGKAKFPQAGDYVHFRSINGVGLVSDNTVDSLPGIDSLRKDEPTVSWNIAPAYNVAAPRLPSPWVLITGDVNSYAERLIPEGYGAVPPTSTVAPNLPNVEVLTFDAFKDVSDFKKALKNNSATDARMAKYDYIPHGWFVKSDMSALIVADTATEKAIGGDYKKVYFDYEVQLFTNLGNHVLTKKGRIYCDDSKNTEKDKSGQEIKYFENKNCVDKPKNFYIMWNLKDENDRYVGSGAFISKLKTKVKLEGVGTRNKFNKTEMWGVRHATSVPGSNLIFVQ